MSKKKDNIACDVTGLKKRGPMSADSVNQLQHAEREGYKVLEMLWDLPDERLKKDLFLELLYSRVMDLHNLIDAVLAREKIKRTR